MGHGLRAPPPTSHAYTIDSLFTVPENTVVWEKFTIGYFRVKIVRGKTFLSLGVSDENFLTMKYFKGAMRCL